jgi:hypothetical protein
MNDPLVNGAVKNALKAQVADWITWAVRALIPLIFVAAIAMWNTINSIEKDVAVLVEKVDSHSSQLNAIWQRVAPPVVPSR